MKTQISLIETPREELEQTHELDADTGLWRRKGNVSKESYKKRMRMRLEFDVEIIAYSSAEANIAVLQFMKEEIPSLEDLFSKTLVNAENIKVNKMRVVK
jgi:hypothetical protein